MQRLIVFWRISYFNFINNMFSDLRNPKSKKQFDNGNKSSTVLNLPEINKTLKYSQTQRKQNKLSYIETINNISENVEYSDKNTFYLTSEQSRLKQILKKMNNDTLHIIDTIRPKKHVVKISKEQLSLLAEKQVQNSKKSIAIMQLQIQKLQQKWTKIVQQQQEQEITNKMKEIRQEIEQIKNSNFAMKLHIDKDGKQIVKQYSQGYDFKLTCIENDKLMAQQKLQKLKTDNNKVIEQTKKTQIRLKDVQSKIQEYDEEYQLIKNSCLSETINKNNQFSLKERKYQYQTIKKRMDYQNNLLQYKYYKLLKQLQNKKNACDQLIIKETTTNQKIHKTKEDITLYQKQIVRLRKKRQQKDRNVRIFLQQQLRNKQQFSQLGQSTIINRQMSSTEAQINKMQGIDLNRKWQSQPLDQISQKIMESQISHHEIDKQAKNEIKLQNQQGENNNIFKLSHQEQVNNKPQ